MNEILECHNCGRPLKDAKSRERGYGPKCWQKLKEKSEEAE
ncbi:DUF6011 domain-containing protein [Geomicrobium sediminis]|uniref:Uncharacterized protein n=1 Tax=Geomicrobium sediminis TaxID=1347788 RepID=A0ABS2PFK6_9BACL|nr:DUF6011 domain-containing protein [Geomicrobium sediminis]MBM7634047.1 hypothetical protein [Geomicrobium sediminis]